MIGVAHAAWDPKRHEPLQTLLAQIPGAFVSSSKRKEHASVWAPRLWRKLYDSALRGEWCIALNDDVVVDPEGIRTALDAVPLDVDAVSLATVQPEAREAYNRGERWLASYLATGPGYAIRREALKDLIDFHANKLTTGMRATMNEDEVIAHWTWANQKPIWQCVPALVKHDVGVPSTLGFDNHPMRVASLLWTETGEVRDWPIPPNGPMYCKHPWLGEGRMKAVRRAYQNGWDFNERCVFCADRPVLILSPTTGAGICGQCVSDAVGHVLTNARIA